MLWTFRSLSKTLTGFGGPAGPLRVGIVRPGRTPTEVRRTIIQPILPRRRGPVKGGPSPEFTEPGAGTPLAPAIARASGRRG